MVESSSVDTPARSALSGLFVRKECWRLSHRGWLLFLLLFFGLAGGFLFTIYPLLAVTHRVDGKVLVVEGWIHEYGIRAAATEFKTGAFERVFVTGGPVAGTGPYINDYNTAASVGADRLKQAGLAESAVQMVPSRISGRDRTYSAAIALRDWFREHGVKAGRINVLTEDLHARRSRLLFQKALGPGIDVGIIGIPNPDYPANRWWRYSEGVREVLGEGIAYVYARIFFVP
jgi:uncharacterized SAM-binding protein YcdF (DUF218 family)